VLVTVIVMRVWRKAMSPSRLVGRNTSLAQKLGYTETDRQGELKIISSSQLSRRPTVGLLAVVLFFIALVWQLIRLGAITADLIIDASVLQPGITLTERQVELSTRDAARCLATKFIPSSVASWFLPLFFWSHRQRC